MDKISKSEYYECSTCKINTLTEGRMCPCPRGGCDAQIVGEITTVMILTKFPDGKQI